MSYETGLFTPDFVTGSQVNCDTDMTIHNITDNTQKVSSANGDKRHANDDAVFSTATTELNKQHIVRLPTGSKNLDNLLDGGIEAGVTTQIYGPPGSGKTQLCNTLCVMLPSDYRAIYIDTEGSFRPERIKAIAKARGLDSGQILQKILVTKALDSKQQESCIESAFSACETNSNNKIKLLIVDSIINHYRAEYAGRSKLPERIQRLNKSMHTLLKTASSNGVAVVVTNHQMQSSVDGSFDNRIVPLGGNVMSYTSTYTIHPDKKAVIYEGTDCELLE